MPRLPRLSTCMARLAVAVWFAAMLTLSAALLAKHVVALPFPVNERQLSASLTGLRTTNQRGKWLAVHVLYSECRCSERVVAHLASTTRPSGWEEIVLWVGQSSLPPPLDKHYQIKNITSRELARLGVDAAPLLVVLDPQDELRYVGGYSEREQGPGFDDLRILANAQRTDRLDGLPVFGCAVSTELKRRLSIIPGL